MGSLFDRMENTILDSIFGASTTYSSPANYYIGLSTATIGEAGPGSIIEPSGSGYARVGVSNNLTTWTASSGGAKSNAITLTFPAASGAWGTVVDFFLADVSGAGATQNYWAYGTLAASKTIQSGDTASFAVGDLDITLT